MRKKIGAALVGLAALSLTLTACGGGSDDGGSGETGGALDTSAATGDVNYWLWDASQLPAYQACADAFKTVNPNVNIKISQYAWDDYWSKITNGFVAGDAPDVFTDHLSKYGQFITDEQLFALDDTLTKDNFNVDQYQTGLADLWKGEDGKRYGLPKDFDTVGLFYNTKMVTDGGFTADQLGQLKWNPTDGGDFEKVVAHLTVDNNGVRGDEAGFDKSKVKVYGLGLDGGSGSGNGQTQWSMYTGSNGFTYTDKNPWGTKYNYDNPAFQQTISWYKGLIDKGYMPSVAAVTGQDSSSIFGAGKYAMLTNGSWQTNALFGAKGIEVGLAPTPIGPSGNRASMYNGLADSVWVGSKNKPAAVKWVEYLGSPDCQNIVGDKAIVFPAIPSATEKAIAAWKAKDIDVSPFTNQVTDKTTFLFPITNHAAEIEGIMHPAMDAVLSGSQPVESLTEANTQVNGLFQ
ncbi:MAG TPA: sugar ABC transporter substrate-binding protein [Propionibacteriaceae bacterium]